MTTIDRKEWHQMKLEEPPPERVRPMPKDWVPKRHHSRAPHPAWEVARQQPYIWHMTDLKSAGVNHANDRLIAEGDPGEFLGAQNDGVSYICYRPFRR